MSKILDKIRLWIKKINRTLKELDTYDRLYFDGKLFSVIIFMLCLLIECFIITSIIILD